MILKVCGMTDFENMQALRAAKPDWMGLIFYPGSPRYVGDSEDAVAISGLPFSRVGVFVNDSLANIQEQSKKFNLQYIQLHGEESPEFCRSLMLLGFKVIKVFLVSDQLDQDLLMRYQEYVTYFLFDTKSDRRGGSGLQFSWSVLQDYRLAVPFILSGGIGPEDVEKLSKIEHEKLAGIDINSRFELEPGIKDIDRIRKFRIELWK